jgi:hypothetical protein
MESPGSVPEYALVGEVRHGAIDSGCTKTVFRNKDKLVNLRVPEHNYVVHGVSCKLPVTLVGDFSVALKHKEQLSHREDHHGVLVRPESICQPACYRQPARRQHRTAHFQHKGIYLLPLHQDCMTHSAGAASHQFRALTEVELWQLRL